MTSTELRAHFPAISRRRLALHCPYCGRIHRKMRCRILAATFLFVAALIAWTAPIARAGSEPDAISVARERQSSGRPVQQAVIVPTATPRETLAPIAMAIPSPTPLPIPTTGVIWSPTSSGAYLYVEPGKTILLEIPNGVFAHLFDEFAAYGNLPWTRVRFESHEGWVDATRVHRVRFEGETFYLVDEDGTYLYAAPQGQSLVWLPAGTPLRFQETENGWAAVTTLDGEAGWVLLDNLLPPD